MQEVAGPLAAAVVTPRSWLQDASKQADDDPTFPGDAKEGWRPCLTRRAHHRHPWFGGRIHERTPAKCKAA
jgi:hypothetical protein